MTYIALQRLRVGEGVREHGDPVPEAAEWPWQIRDTYIRNHRIKEAPDTTAATVKGGKARVEG